MESSCLLPKAAVDCRDKPTGSIEFTCVGDVNGDQVPDDIHFVPKPMKLDARQNCLEGSRLELTLNKGEYEILPIESTGSVESGNDWMWHLEYRVGTWGEVLVAGSTNRVDKKTAWNTVKDKRWAFTVKENNTPVRFWFPDCFWCCLDNVGEIRFSVQGRMCASPPPLPLGGSYVADCKNTDSGEQCAIKCDDQYKLVGTVYACVFGKWYNPPKCELMKCANEPPAPTNGKSTGTCNGKIHGELCDVTCNDGYLLKSKAQCSKGTWIPGSCTEKQCTVLPTSVQDGTWGCMLPVQHNSECALTCKPAVNFKQPTKAKCNLGSWQSTATCSPLDCPVTLPNPLNGQYKNCKSTHGSECAVTCNVGYTANGPTAKCNYGKWVATANCQAVKCKTAPQYPDANIGKYDNCIDATHTAACKLTCSAGYAASGPAVCTNGQWTLASCHKVETGECTKPPTDPTNGKYINCATAPNGATCRLQCDDGYTATVAETKCVNAAFTTLGQCTPANCNFKSAPPPTPLNGKYSACPDEIMHNEICKVICEDGFDSEEGGAKCTHGSWGIVATCRPRGCPSAPQLPSGASAILGCDKGGEHSQVCTLQCSAGYAKSGDLICSHGVWSTQSCTAVGCSGKPNNPINGTHSDCQNAKVGDTCPLVCNDGYEADGNTTCSVGSAWQTANCRPAACKGKPAAPVGATLTDVNCSDKPSGQSCAVTCPAGSEAAGVIKCEAGVWSTVSCEPKGCSGSPVVKNGNPTNSNKCNNLKHGGACNVTCDTGFTSIGEISCEFGQWDVPQCVPAPKYRCVCQGTGGPRYGLTCELASTAVPLASFVATDLNPNEEFGEGQWEQLSDGKIQAKAGDGKLWICQKS